MRVSILPYEEIFSFGQVEVVYDVVASEVITDIKVTVEVVVASGLKVVPVYSFVSDIRGLSNGQGDDSIKKGQQE